MMGGMGWMSGMGMMGWMSWMGLSNIHLLSQLRQ